MDIGANEVEGVNDSSEGVFTTANPLSIYASTRRRFVCVNGARSSIDVFPVRYQVYGGVTRSGNNEELNQRFGSFGSLPATTTRP